MRTDSLQEFVKLRRQLAEEKATIEKRLSQINEALGELPAASSGRAPTSALSSVAPARASGGGGKRQMSPEARARIAEAQRKRWAASRKGQGGTASASAQPKAEAQGGAKRKMSAAGRRAIAEAARRRWAAAKAAGKSRL